MCSDAHKRRVLPCPGPLILKAILRVVVFRQNAVCCASKTLPERIFDRILSWKDKMYSKHLALDGEPQLPFEFEEEAGHQSQLFFRPQPSISHRPIITVVRNLIICM